MHIEATAYLKLRASSSLFPDSYNDTLQFWRDLSSVSSLAQSTNGCSAISKITVKVGRGIDVPQPMRKEHPLWTFQVFSLSAMFEIDMDSIIPRHEVLADIAPSELAFEVASSDMYKSINDFALASSISRPGCFDAARFIIASHGYEYSSDLGIMTNTLTHVLERSRAIEWPPIITLSIEDTWIWLQQLSGSELGHGTGRVGRAVAALSYLAVRKDYTSSPVDLVWAMIGLESLFGKGNAGLKSQIIEKTKVLIGRPTEHKKRFDSIYDYRSRFVHGDLDLPFSYCLHDGSKHETDQFFSESTDCEEYASMILVSCIQQLVVRKLHSLEFEYHVAPAPCTGEA